MCALQQAMAQVYQNNMGAIIVAEQNLGAIIVAMNEAIIVAGTGPGAIIVASSNNSWDINPHFGLPACTKACCGDETDCMCMQVDPSCISSPLVITCPAPCCSTATDCYCQSPDPSCTSKIKKGPNTVEICGDTCCSNNSCLCLEEQWWCKFAFWQ